MADVFNEYKMSLDHLIWWWWRWCWWWFYGDDDDDFDYDDDDDFDDGPVLNWHVFSMNANRVWIHREIERSESWNLILSIMGSTYLNTNSWKRTNVLKHHWKTIVNMKSYFWSRMGVRVVWVEIKIVKQVNMPYFDKHTLDGWFYENVGTDKIQMMSWHVESMLIDWWWWWWC